MFPDKNAFKKLAKKGTVVPVYEELIADFDTPLSVFRKLGTSDYSFLLESVEGGERLARYSFLGNDPALIFEVKGTTVHIRENGKAVRSYETKDPFGEIRSILKQFRPVAVKGLPRFSGGLVGFLGYDTVRFIEDLPDKNPDELGLPDAVFMLSDMLFIFDHVDHTIKIVANVRVGEDPVSDYNAACRRIKKFSALLKKPYVEKVGPAKSVRPGKIKVKSNFTFAQFKKAVSKAKEYIRKGDVIQVVPSQRFRVPVKSEPFQIYRALRSINPSPYMYYLKLGDFYLVGSSPEIMVRCEDRTVEVRPIAGTRPRGASEEEDAARVRELLADPKERAEHIMLVDLGRNDLGRVCEYDSIKVSELMTVEKYSHVMHIVTDVKGRLLRGNDAVDVIKATFPAGTVSGAPKVRAMEIIDEIENVRRGTYAGCVGYFSFSGNLDFCITIRTIVLKDDVAYVQAGCGIVADSDPAREYQETVNKAKALVKAIERAERGLE